ncbi:hypothetical protein GH5_03234 [Leishmania sp. Ghana 2012 LV757]|uniref:hypothetical protein n=1 Tax=Leishmania sp. Ghana 2012 LV757 TaxID=2803181 RepID=UPI001B6FBF01|nr:hypothetical protein GH5_03234 [Leishmania sp. Ghana 2012 LV757]
MDAMNSIMTTPKSEAPVPLPFSAASCSPLRAGGHPGSGTEAHKRSPRKKEWGAGAPHTALLSSSPAMTSAPRVPILQLAVHAAENEVSPAHILYTRLFREAEERLQRQPCARKRRAAAQQLQKESCTHHPYPLLSLGESTACQSFATPNADAPSANKSAQVSSGAAQIRNPHASARTSARMGDTGARNKRTEAGHTPEAAACERLYRNATEQAERRERRRQALQEAQEAEFQATCTFHPSLSSVKEGFLGRSATQRVRSRSAGAGGVASARGAAVDPKGGSGASPHRAKGSSAVQRTPSRSWRHFSVAQEEIRAADKRHLGEWRRRTEEGSKPSLYAGVPSSNACEHLLTHLEKVKGSKGPVDGWSEHFAHFRIGKQASATAAAKVALASAGGCEPVSGAPPARTSLPDYTSLRGRSPHSESDPGGMLPGIVATAQHQTSACSGVHAQSKAGQGGAAAAALPQVFSRLFRDSDERRAVRAFMQLVREQGEYLELRNAKTARNGACASARTARSGQRSSSAPSHKDTAAASTLASSGAAARGTARQRTDADGPFAVSRTVFDALSAEQEELQRRPGSHFRSDLSKRTDAKSDGKVSCTAVIDHPTLAQQQRMSDDVCRAGHWSVPAAAAAVSFLSPLRKRTPCATGTRTSIAAMTRDPVPVAEEDLERFSINGVEGYETLKSVSPLLQRWHDVVYANSVHEPAMGAMGSPEQRHRSHLGAPHDSASTRSLREVNGRTSAVGGPNAVGKPRFQDAIKENIGTVQIAGAASSAYLRQLESELQDALKDWPHGARVPTNEAKPKYLS